MIKILQLSSGKKVYIQGKSITTDEARKEVKVNNNIIGPVDKVTNVKVDLGPRMIMAGNEVLGTADNISIMVAEATKEELEKLKAANEVRLVKMLGESGTGEQT